MAVNFKLLYGNSVSENPPPAKAASSMIRLKGKWCGKPASFDIGQDELSKHMLLMGGTGCGKTTLFYHFVDQIRKAMSLDDVMIIFDSKGDFISQFYKPGDLLIGNSRQYASKSEKWNIYKEILADGWEDKDFVLNTQEICKSFFEERTKNTTNAFFPNAARDLMAAIIIAIIREGKQNDALRKENLFNKELKGLLDSCNFEKIAGILEGHIDLGAVLSYIDGDGSQSQGVISEMFSVMREIFIGVFADKGGFSVREFVRRKENKALFIEYDLSIGSILTPVYRLMFDLALKEALGRNKPQGNVYLICDEFKLLPHLRHIDDGVNFGRSLGVKVMAGIQSIEQLFEIYGKSRGMNIAAGFSTLFAFRANDVSTRDYVSGLFGKNIMLEQYQKFDTEIIEEKRKGSTVEDWDMNSLQVGEAIVGLPFSKPFRFSFDRY
ncbi:MAG: type IV secretion system DNA-binding domain-containing protein [Clostridiales Family XIII bacterium]|jgi:type IV secretory pathway TraG/TraD family ATPase VirD4|nr:type IV secretion system DNA-binding domain-containing protein [Clostridiales Family XIII bacterium]